MRYILMYILAVTVVLGILVISSCSMNNKEIIRQTQICEKAGMRARVLTDLGEHVVEVQCWPKEEEKPCK